MVAGQGSKEGTVREFEMDMYTLLYLKWITNKDLLQHLELCSMLYAAWRGGKFGGEHIHVSIWLGPLLVT